MSEKGLICNEHFFGFSACDCPDYGSSDCPRTIPGAKCLMDSQYAKEIMESKMRYYERKAVRR